MSAPTASIEQIAAQLTEAEAKILARYGSGEGVKTIVERAQAAESEVARIIDDIAGFNPGYARTLAQAFNQARRNASLAAAKVPVTAAVPVAPKAPAPVADVIANLLTRAVETQVPKLVRLADKIQDLVDQLEQELGEREKEAKLRAEAAELEARLAQIKRELGPKRTTPPAARPDTAPDNRAVREWAAANGMEVSAHGRIPQSVMVAFSEGGAQ